MIAMNKPEHRFFERILDNNLEDLSKFLFEKQDEILSGKIGNIPADLLANFNATNGAATQLGTYYNVFTFENEGIQKLKSALKDMTIEACNYYGIDFSSNDFKIHGWFNVDYKFDSVSISPKQDNRFYHDHMNGEGAPVFHGYYSINAEPSITYYKINNLNDFENVNVNNRAILSETGHPHGRDDWYQDTPRITLAYDIAPSSYNVGEKWIQL